MFLAADHPWYLLLLAVVPLLWWQGRRSLAGLGAVRRWLVLLLRTAVVTLLVLALAQLEWVHTSRNLTVLYLLDQSQSIPEPQLRKMAQFVNESIARGRETHSRDRAGVIVFGREAAIEYPPVDATIQIRDTVESPVDGRFTSLAAALKLAQIALPGDSAGRVVLVTDGNENQGHALDAARALADQGIGIDVMPIRYQSESDVAVEKIKVPSDVNRADPFDLHVVLNNVADPSRKTPVKGRLRVSRRTSDSEQTVVDEAVELAPGKRVFSIREQLEQADHYTYEARFVPDDPAGERFAQNNAATSFTTVRGQGRVLLIEDAENRGEFDLLVQRLRTAGLHVTVMNTQSLFTSLSEVRPFDTVLLANVPREAFSDEQIQMLVTNTRQMGAGLVMLGGPNSFGAGGWTNSEVEAAMPVDFQIKNAKVAAVGALALVIDRSGSMSGENIVMAKAAAIAAVNVLAPHDYVTVTAFDSTGYLIVPLTKNENSRFIKSRIDRISADGGTDMGPAIELAQQQLKKATDAALRHMVILTDGQTAGSDYPRMIRTLRQQNITVSTVAVGNGADKTLLSQLAGIGGGKFYHATSPRALPRIFQREARIVSRPLIYERTPGFQGQVSYPHEMVKGIEALLPPMTGYVLTNTKESPLVEVALRAPLPAGEENRTLLAGWTYGLGRAVAFTSDAGRRWTADWAKWPGYDKLFSQIVRWSMRPPGDQGRYHVATDLKDGKLHVAITALDNEEKFLNLLQFSGSAVGPDLKPHELKIEQIAPGRYAGELPVTDSGTYFVSLSPSSDSAPIVTGVDVPYSAEFLDREENAALLTSLAGLTPRGGKSGLLLDQPPSAETGKAEPGKVESTQAAMGKADSYQSAANDAFRHDLLEPTTSREAWPMLVFIAGCVFFVDVFARRVHVGFSWVPHYAGLLRNRLMRRETTATMQSIERLRSRKVEVNESIAARREGIRFEPSENASLGGLLDDAPSLTTAPRPAPPTAPSMGPEAESESYTSRLLRAKRKVWEGDQRDGGQSLDSDRQKESDQ